MKTNKKIYPVIFMCDETMTYAIELHYSVTTFHSKIGITREIFSLDIFGKLNM